MPYRDLDVLDAAEKAADRINHLLDRSAQSARPLIRRSQLRRSAHAVGDCIREGFGRRSGPDRTYRLEIARAEAEETIGHLRANFRARRLEPVEYWRLHNQFVVIVKMLTSLVRD